MLIEVFTSWFVFVGIIPNNEKAEGLKRSQAGGGVQSMEPLLSFSGFQPFRFTNHSSFFPSFATDFWGYFSLCRK